MNGSESDRPIRFGSRARGTVRPPGSKSVTNRALNLALLSADGLELTRPLISEDTEAMIGALERLGHGVSRAGDRLVVGRPAAAERAAIDCGASGTMLRFLTASLPTRPGQWHLDGTERLRQRPLGPLIEALRELGAEIECLDREGFAPLRLRGGTLRGGRARLDAGASSQFLSALLMASVCAASEVSVSVTRLTSAPYVELTLQVMADLGLSVRRSGDEYSVRPQRIRPSGLEVEADYSSGCYFGASAALTAGRVRLAGLRPDSAQGDARFFALLERMGAHCRWVDGELEVGGPDRLTAISEICADIPDQVPTLAVLAAFAKGSSRLREVAHLRLKESDRLSATAEELERIGVDGVIEESDALIVPGVWSDTPPPSEPTRVQSHDDHRIAMSFALAGLRRPGVSIREPGVVAKSYPGFWSDFEAVCEAGG